MKGNEASLTYGDAFGTQTWLARIRLTPLLGDGLRTSIQRIETGFLDVIDSFGASV